MFPHPAKSGMNCYVYFIGSSFTIIQNRTYGDCLCLGTVNNIPIYTFTCIKNNFHLQKKNISLPPIMHDKTNKPKSHTIMKLYKYILQTFPSYSHDFFLYYLYDKTNLHQLLNVKSLLEIKSILVNKNLLPSETFSNNNEKLKNSKDNKENKDKENKESSADLNKQNFKNNSMNKQQFALSTFIDSNKKGSQQKSGCQNVKQNQENMSNQNCKEDGTGGTYLDKNNVITSKTSESDFQLKRIVKGRKIFSGADCNSEVSSNKLINQISQIEQVKINCKSNSTIPVMPSSQALKKNIFVVSRDDKLNNTSEEDEEFSEDGEENVHISDIQDEKTDPQKEDGIDSVEERKFSTPTKKKVHRYYS